MRRQYSKGIDKTEGCTSNRLGPPKQKNDVSVKYEVHYDASTGKFISSNADEGVVFRANLARKQLARKAAAIMN